jgi:pimeloyl-ACP methyl ester carboxylesterase
MATPLPDLDGLMASVAACRAHDALAELSMLTIPTLVISGTLDTVARTDLPERIAAAIPNAQLQEIRSGHMMIWEQPASFERIVREFIASAN